MNSSNSEFNPFSETEIPNPLSTINDVQNVVAYFRDVSEYDIYDPNLQNNIGKIRNEGKEFRKLTIESATTSDEIADYCSFIATTIESLAEGYLTGEDFSDMLKELLDTAIKCKEKAVYFKIGYTQINSNLNEICYDLQSYGEYIEESKNKLVGDLSDEYSKQESAKKKRNTNIVGSLLGIAGAPLTGGLSLLVTTRSAYKVAKNQLRVEESRDSIALTKEEYSDLSETGNAVQRVQSQTKNIIENVDKFIYFWSGEMDRIKKYIGNFEKRKEKVITNRGFAKVTVKEWEKAQKNFTDYSNLIKYNFK